METSICSDISTPVHLRLERRLTLFLEVMTIRASEMKLGKVFPSVHSSPMSRVTYLIIEHKISVIYSGMTMRGLGTSNGAANT